MINRITALVLFIGLAWGQESEKVIAKWDNGVTKKIHYYKGSGFDEELIGIKTFYPNGDLHWQCRYKNNKRHGEYSFYLEGNKLLIKGNFNNGEKSGEWSVYHPKEMTSNNFYFVADLEPYEAKLLNATNYIVNFYFHSNGELGSYEVKLKSKVKTHYGGKFPFHDTSYYWHENGMKKLITDSWGAGDEYESGFNNKTWHDDGKLSSEILLKDNGTTMKSTTYYRNGNIEWQKEIFKGNTVIDVKYDSNGNMIHH